MATIAATLEGVASALRAAGVYADVDPSKVNLPGVWVELALVDPSILAGGGFINVNLNLATTDGPYVTVVETLTDLLTQVDAVVDIEGDVTPQVLAMPDASLVPSWQVPVRLPFTLT